MLGPEFERHAATGSDAAPTRGRKAERLGKSGRRLLPDDEVTAATRKMRMLRSLACGNKYEKLARATGAVLIAGVDEVGRGALFGPVVAAAVILPLDTRIRGLRDSKQLLQEDRERLAAIVRARAIAVAVEEVDAETIDRVNIYQASRMAMAAAVVRLDPQPDHLLIDALLLDLPHAQTKIIYGDSLSISIAAASVVAKVYRDRRMCEMDAAYPGYGLASHKGYATPEHREALQTIGPSALHRRSFMPVLQGELPWEDFVAEEGPEEQGLEVRD
ncbi:MAG: ribonuclease HII [Acidobacteriaceae bacterium]